MFRKSKAIRQIKTAKNLDEAYGLLNSLLPELGLNYFMFSQVGTQDSPSTFRVNFYKTTFPEEWINLYIKNRYLYIDPIAKRVMNNEMPFFWSEHMASSEVDEETALMMQHAQEYGLCDGIACSYLKNKGQLYAFSLARDSLFEEYDESILGEIYLIGAYLANLHQKENTDSEHYSELTSREKEVISMAALGKTDAEIAQLAGISINTIRFHWKNIFVKMNSYSRVFAIIRALNLGYIDPHIFEIPTESGSYNKKKKAV